MPVRKSGHWWNHGDENEVHGVGEVADVVGAAGCHLRAAGGADDGVGCVREGGAMILPQSDVKDLTGYTRVSAQIRWLRRHGWKFTVNGLGMPIVALAEFNRHLVGGKGARVQELNLEGING
jgi:Domain of unknown function (DUF4224)